MNGLEYKAHRLRCRYDVFSACLDNSRDYQRFRG